MSKTKPKKPTAQQIAHHKFLMKMGAAPEQIKERRRKLRSEKNNIQLKIDSLSSVRKAYEEN